MDYKKTVEKETSDSYMPIVRLKMKEILDNSLKYQGKKVTLIENIDNRKILHDLLRWIKNNLDKTSLLFNIHYKIGFISNKFDVVVKIYEPNKYADKLSKLINKAETRRRKKSKDQEDSQTFKCIIRDGLLNLLQTECITRNYNLIANGQANNRIGFVQECYHEQSVDGDIITIYRILTFME
jgi:Family of unknown function (DUF5864)